jgi:hypothetical protein
MPDAATRPHAAAGVEHGGRVGVEIGRRFGHGAKQGSAVAKVTG